MSVTTEAVTALLAKYNEALNASSTEAAMPLYAEDGVFMPPYSESAVGSSAVRKAEVRAIAFVSRQDTKNLGYMVEAVAGGKLIIPIGSRLPLRNAADAHVVLAAGGSGKILLVP
jgi:ketosteroid isomerase-like protein